MTSWCTHLTSIGATTRGHDFATSIRSAYNVPLYLGESGENSMSGFRDAIHLLEDLQIGWAWWPLKKWRAFPRALH